MPTYVILMLVTIVVFSFMLTLIFLIRRFKRMLIRICSVLVFVGFFIYTAFYLSAVYDRSADSILAAFQGVFSTIRMFFLHIDPAVFVTTPQTQWLTGNIWMQVLLWICHMAAAILMQLVLLSLFGNKLIDGIRILCGLYSEVYIIKGSDKRAIMLGENIALYDGRLSRPGIKRLVLYLLDDSEDRRKVYNEVSHFGGIVKALNKETDFYYYFKRLRLGKRRLLKRTYKVIIMPGGVTTTDYTYLASEHAKKAGADFGDLDIFAFVSEEWDRKIVEELAQKEENGEKMYPYTFHIVSEKDLLVRQMIKEHPPFECPRLNFCEKGVAAQNFTVMVLGFGEVGQRALLRLIMNGQFFGSNMRAIVIDREMEHLREHFLHCHPYFKHSCEKYKSDGMGLDFKLDSEICNIEGMGIDVRDEEFYQLLEQIPDIDYIVIALGDDVENKQLACDLRLHYERKYASALPTVAVFEKDGGSAATNLCDGIFKFGCPEEIYKDSVVIRESEDIMAKAVHETYTELYGGKPWHKLDWFTHESNRATADFISAMLYLAGGLTAAEALVKGNIVDDDAHAEILAQTEHMRWNAFHAAMGYGRITIEEMRQRFAEYEGEKFSREHLDYCRRDTKLGLHACLASWDELDNISAVYRELALKAGNEKEQKRNFKENDRDVVKYIPKFLQRR